jgi:hypothetical protein
MCFSSPNPPPPPPAPPPPPPPPSPVAEKSLTRAQVRGVKKPNKKGTRQLTQVKRKSVGGSYQGSGLNLPS